MCSFDVAFIVAADAYVASPNLGGETNNAATVVVTLIVLVDDETVRYLCKLFLPRVLTRNSKK